MQSCPASGYCNRPWLQTFKCLRPRRAVVPSHHLPSRLHECCGLRGCRPYRPDARLAIPITAFPSLLSLSIFHFHCLDHPPAGAGIIYTVAAAKIGAGVPTGLQNRLGVVKPTAWEVRFLPSPLLTLPTEAAGAFSNRGRICNYCSRYRPRFNRPFKISTNLSSALLINPYGTINKFELRSIGVFYGQKQFLGWYAVPGRVSQRSR